MCQEVQSCRHEQTIVRAPHEQPAVPEVGVHVDVDEGVAVVVVLRGQALHDQNLQHTEYA